MDNFFDLSKCSARIALRTVGVGSVALVAFSSPLIDLVALLRRPAPWSRRRSSSYLDVEGGRHAADILPRTPGAEGCVGCGVMSRRIGRRGHRLVRVVGEYAPLCTSLDIHISTHPRDAWCGAQNCHVREILNDIMNSSNLWGNMHPRCDGWVDWLWSAHCELTF